MISYSFKAKACVFAAFLGGAFAACQQPINVENESKILLKTDIEFSQASERDGAAEAFYAYLTDDAMQMPQGGEPVYGREKIREEMSSGVNITLTWKPQKAEVARSGDLGWTWGTYVAKWQDEGDAQHESHGKYLNIWKKQEDGAWKVAVDMGNQNPAPADQQAPDLSKQ